MFSTLFSLLPSRFSRPHISLLAVAVSALLLPLAEHSFAQITVGGSNPITITSSNDGVGVSASSTITVTAAELPSTATVTAISLTFNSLDSTQLNAQAIALTAPSGTALDLLSGVCNSGSATFTLADTGATGSANNDGLMPGIGFGNNCPSALSGTYLPTDYFAGEDVFNNGGGGPASYDSAGIGNTKCAIIGSGLNCGTFNFSTAFGLPAAGSSLVGTWTLYIATQATPIPTGSLGSWTITFTTEAAAATTTSLVTSNNGQTSNVFTNGNVGGQTTTGTQVTLTATITSNSNPVTAGTVTFYDSTGTNPGLGTVLASAVPVNGSGQASANVTFSASEEGSRTISATYNGVSGTYASSSTPPGGEVTELTVNQPYNPTSTTFCNGPVAINNGGPVGGTAGSPYPSQLVLGSSFSQLQGTIESVTLTLNGLASQQPNFLGFLVQAPSGNALEAMSWADGAASTISGPLDVFLADGGSGGLQASTENRESCTSGSPCSPADDYSQESNLYTDTFPSPAPSASLIGKAFPTGASTFASQFGGSSANGTWSLYLNNWLPENAPYGQIASWCLNFTMQANAHPTQTTVSGSPNPVSTQANTAASVNLTASVSVTDTSGLTVNGGSVSFVDGATTLGTSPVSNGVAVLAASLGEGTHQIVASYSGTNSGTEFGISTGAYDQRVDTATTIPTSGTGVGPYTFCNTGGITSPGMNNDSGPASPYPSNIFVTGLPGTVNAVTVSLNNFQTKDQGDLLSLLVGPGGNNLDFFSLTGNDVSNPPSPFNLVFSDTASSSVTENLVSSGTFLPTSDNTDHTYPQCPSNAPLCGIESVGPSLASNPFTPTHKAATAGTAVLGNANEAGVFGGTPSSTYNGNGIWSLYLVDSAVLTGGETTTIGNWCVSLTQNLPSISVEPQSSSTFTQGGTGSFQVNITNDGISGASPAAGPIGDPTKTTANAMTVTDTLPNGLTYSGFTGTDWSCSASGHTVTCTNQDTVDPDASFNPLTINVNVSGTASGELTNTVSVSDAEAANTPTPNSGQVTIDVPPSITSAASTTFTVGAAGSFSVTTGAATYPTASLSKTGPLPSGVTFTDNGNGTATLAGPPASGTGGQYPITITAANGASPNATQNFTLTVDQAPGISSNNNATFTSGMAGSFTVTTAAGTYPTAALSESGSLPGTVMFTDNGNGTGTLAGTPGAATSYGITFTAQNGIAPNATQSFTLNVLPGLASRLAITVPPSALPRTAFNFTVTAYDTFGNQATGYGGTVHFTSSDPGATLPANATLINGAGTFSATLVTPGTQTMTATDTVNNGLTITSSGIVVSSPNFGSVNVCPGGRTTPAPCSNTQTFSFNIPAGTTIGSVGILTTGAANLDFQAEANDTSTTLCKAQTYSSATTCTVDVTFAPLAPGERNGAVQIVDGSGNILANTYIYGPGVGPAITFSPSPTIQVAPDGNYHSSLGVAVDAKNDVFVSEEGGVYEILAVNGSIPATPTINPIGGGYDIPFGVAVDGAGNVFVADTFNNAVEEVLAVNGVIPPGATPVTIASLNKPYGIAVDRSGNIFISQQSEQVISEIPLVGGQYGSPVGLVGGSPAISLTVDGSGNLFFADPEHSKVEEVMAVNGVIPASPTIKTLGSGFNSPTSVAVDAAGNVYVFDGSNTVQEILAVNGAIPANPTINTLASGFHDPVGLAVDGNGNLFAADQTSFNLINEIPRAQPPALSFDSTIVGSTSSDSPQSVQFQNIGNATLTGSGVLSDTTDFTVVAGPGIIPDCTVATLSLAPGAACNLSIDFTPQSAAPISATITATDNTLNANPATQTISLSGTGLTPTPPQAQVSPSSLQFTTIPFGGSPETLSFMVTNIGGGTLTIAPKINGPSYKITSNGCAGGVPSTVSCTLQVEFAPVAVGGHGDILTLNANGSSNPTVALHGVASGVGTEMETPLQFGTIPFGQSKPLVLTINNVGVAGNVMIGAKINGPSYKIQTASTNPCQAGVTAGHSCNLLILFDPVAVGNHDDVLTLTPTGGAAPSIVYLHGTAD
jgi:Bacterial Ig-like domain (group 3)